MSTSVNALPLLNFFFPLSCSTNFKFPKFKLTADRTGPSDRKWGGGQPVFPPAAVGSLHRLHTVFLFFLLTLTSWDKYSHTLVHTLQALRFK